VERVRPVRLAARRQRELMAVIVHNECEDVEWVNDDMIDMSELVDVLEDLGNTSKGPQMNVICTKTRLTSPWININ
jgi:uncharacterized phage-associated protein